jgi:hypothetical protein
MKLINELWDALTYVLQIVVMTAVLTLFLGLLFAPAFEGFVARDLQLKAAGMGCATEEDVRNALWKMTLTRVALWLACIAAWAFLVISNVIYHNIH